MPDPEFIDFQGKFEKCEDAAIGLSGQLIPALRSLVWPTLRLRRAVSVAIHRELRLRLLKERRLQRGYL